MAEINPEAEYEVKLKKSIKAGPVWLRPSHQRIRVRGSTLIEIMDSVSDYKEI